jgi:alpha-galactosidase
VVCELTRFQVCPAAVDWVLYLKNTGTADTPLLDAIRPLDLAVTLPGAADEVLLHRAYGSTCAATDFLPIDEPLPPGADVNLAPNGGRSSDGQLPFFNLQWPDGGVVAAIGWSGQWCARIRREGAGLAVTAGQQFAKFRLHPGEEVRTPRILLLHYTGADRLAGNNRLRRLMLEEYLPRLKGMPVTAPTTHNSWFAFGEGNGVTEANQLEFIRAVAPTGVECFWLDAGWFEGGWPAGVGNWFPRKDAFPNGLKPLGEAAHAAGMKFVVWFEPERVNPASRIGREHPGWVLRNGSGDGLFNLGDPAARQWMTDHLSKCIDDWGIDVYRNDFNIDPLRFWKQADQPDREGITEIRYVEGLYAMWDALRAHHPSIFIDNCASGGRRIDLETMSRSIPLWRSDTSGVTARPMPTQDQVQTAGLSLWVPAHTAGIWSFDPYVYRSVATTGMNCSQDARAAGYPAEAARKSFAEVTRLRPLWAGDFYPLLDITLDARHWAGWQLDRTDLGKGFVVLFRREQSPYAGAVVQVRGVDPGATYRVTCTDTGSVEVRTGEQLGRLSVQIDAAPGSRLIEYERLP